MDYLGWIETHQTLVGFAGVMIALLGNGLLARSQIDGARAHERQVLIQALLAELRWLSGMLDHTSAAVKDQKPELTVLVFPRFKTPILERSLDRLGLLPKDSIGSVLRAYARSG